MASTQGAYGLRPVRRVDGLPYAGQMRSLKIASGYATSIYVGDLVAVGTDGTIQRVSATDTMPAGTVGVFMGVTLTASSTDGILGPNSDIWHAGTVDANATAFVVDDPNVEFLIQANGTLAQTAMHSNFAIVQPGTNGPYRSGIALDASSAAVTATLPFKLIDFFTGPDSKPGDAYTDVIVRFNPGSHAYLTATGVA